MGVTIDLARKLERDTSAYHLDGKRLVSVTEALSLAGLVDYSKIEPDVLEAASERGKRVHALTAATDSGGAVDPELAAGVEGYLAAYETFRADSGFAPVLVEHSMVNPRHRYAGTLDRLGWFGKGQLALIDLKCMAAIPRWVGLQLAGYQLALSEEFEGQPIKRYALRLRPNGRYFLHRFSEHTDSLVFLSAVRIALFRVQHEGVNLP